MKNMKEVVNGIFERTRKEIPEFISISLVNISDGMPLAFSSVVPEAQGKGDISSAYGTNAIISCRKALKAMSQKNELIECIYFKPEVLSIFRVIGPKYWMGLGFAPNANLGIIKVLMGKFEEELMKVLY